MHKQCVKCNKIYEKLPEKTKVTDLGVWFNCSCGSTLLMPNRRIKDIPVCNLVDILRNHPEVAILNVVLANEINSMVGGA